MVYELLDGIQRGNKHLCNVILWNGAKNELVKKRALEKSISMPDVDAVMERSGSPVWHGLEPFQPNQWVRVKTLVVARRRNQRTPIEFLCAPRVETVCNVRCVFFGALHSHDRKQARPARAFQHKHARKSKWHHRVDDDDVSMMRLKQIEDQLLVVIVRE